MKGSIITLSKKLKNLKTYRSICMDLTVKKKEFLKMNF